MCSRETNMTLLYEARAAFWRQEYNAAAIMYERALKNYPGMWWLRLEKERAKAKGSLCRVHSLSRPHINCVYTPNYASNKYQEIVYSACNCEKSISLSPLNADDIHSLLNLIEIGKQPVIFHQHWLREIYIGKKDDSAGLSKIKNYFNVLRMLQSLGCKVIWTVHNIFDHDLTQVERRLNKICIEEICKLANLVIVHSRNTTEELESTIGRKITFRVELLKHPLYDSATLIDISIPPEIKAWQSNSEHLVFLSFGMIRPYKGAFDLVQHFTKESSKGKLGQSVLVIAGKIYDDELNNYFNANKNLLERVVFINRRLSEGELAYLCRVADVAVLPYRNILISGSYYQAATFSLPSIVPNIGMFQSEIVNGETGIKYSEQFALGKALVYAYSIGKERLRRIGKRARQSCNGQEEATFAGEYHKLLMSLVPGVRHG